MVFKDVHRKLPQLIVDQTDSYKDIEVVPEDDGEDNLDDLQNKLIRSINQKKVKLHKHDRE